MSQLDKLIFLFLFLAFEINNPGISRKVINTCGNMKYDEPTKSEDCVVEGEICCYVSIRDKKNEITKFCVSSPSDIEKEDVEEKIKDYTGFTVEEIHCNKSQYINNSMFALLFLTFILIFNM